MANSAGHVLHRAGQALHRAAFNQSTWLVQELHGKRKCEVSIGILPGADKNKGAIHLHANIDM